VKCVKSLSRFLRNFMSKALDLVKNIATVDQMRQAVAAGLKPERRLKTNSHIHLPPNFSAFETVEQAVTLADEQDVRVLGVSNYYDYRVYDTFAELAGRKNIFPVFGLEIISLVDKYVKDGLRINDPGNPGRMYICGKGITGFASPSLRAAELLGTIRSRDEKRMAEMTAKVNAIFTAAGVAVNISDADVIDMVVKRHKCPKESVTLQERHVAMAFQQKFFDVVKPAGRAAALSKIFNCQYAGKTDNDVAVQGDIRSYLMKAGKPAFVTETFLKFEEAYELILELGGIPCYPTLIDGAKTLCDYERTPEELVAHLKENNIHMAELIPIRNKTDMLGRYVRAMRKADIAVVGGTEHNTLDLLPLEPQCVGGVEVEDDVREIFFEGMCVAAAHQYQRLNGLAGFVNSQGNRNADIKVFADAGAALIAKYFKKYC